MSENVFTIIQNNWGMIELIVAIVIGTIATKFKIDKDEAEEIADFALENGKKLVDFMSPKNETVATAPEGTPLETYAMQDKIKTLILNGKGQDDMQSILAQITTAEAQGLAMYQIKWSGGAYDIEYGYLADPTQITAPVIKEGDLATVTLSRYKGTIDDAELRWIEYAEKPEYAAKIRSSIRAAEAAGMNHYYVKGENQVYMVYFGDFYGSDLKFAIQDEKNPIQPAPGVA